MNIGALKGAKLCIFKNKKKVSRVTTKKEPRSKCFVRPEKLQSGSKIMQAAVWNRRENEMRPALALCETIGTGKDTTECCRKSWTKIGGIEYVQYIVSWQF